MHRGQEHETRYRLVGDPLIEDGRSIGPHGSVTVLMPPGDIHAVQNDGVGIAVSLHLYGANLRRRGTSVRRRYDRPVLSIAVAARPSPDELTPGPRGPS